jgi:two-component system sensor histidine kinase BaeS
VELVSETLAAYQVAAAERDIRLEECGAQSAQLQADPERLQRVLRNLLDNALRHTPAGGLVRVCTQVDDDEVLLSVDDSGSGVAPAELERIFDRFYRAEPSRLRESGGAGLGLAIARGLVQAHGGRIWAEPSSLGGVSVRISLPAAAEQPAHPVGHPLR